MAGTAAHVEGLKELDRLLKQLPEKIRSRVLGQAVLAGIKGAVKLAKYNAPIAEEDGGTLKRSMTSMRRKRRKNSPYVVASMGPKATAVHPTLTGKDGRPIYAAYYGKVEEYGWKKRGRGQASRPANPFMRMSLMQHAPHVLADMQKNIGKKIEKEAAKLAKK